MSGQIKVKFGDHYYCIKAYVSGSEMPQDYKYVIFSSKMYKTQNRNSTNNDITAFSAKYCYKKTNIETSY